MSQIKSYFAVKGFLEMIEAPQDIKDSLEELCPSLSAGKRAPSKQPCHTPRLYEWAEGDQRPAKPRNRKPKMPDFSNENVKFRDARHYPPQNHSEYGIRKQ